MTVWCRGDTLLLHGVPWTRWSNLVGQQHRSFFFPKRRGKQLLDSSTGTQRELAAGLNESALSMILFISRPFHDLAAAQSAQWDWGHLGSGGTNQPANPRKTIKHSSLPPTKTKTTQNRTKRGLIWTIKPSLPRFVIRHIRKIDQTTVESGFGRPSLA